MGFAFLTALCWAFAGFGSSRLARHFGALPGNALRLTVSFSLLLVIVALRKELGWAEGFGFFVLSGFLHLCVGDVGLFAVYRRLGPRLGVLMVGTLAPPTALLSEWLILGTTVSLPQLLCAGGVLLSVAFAVAPRERQHLSAAELRTGILAGIFAALGQGLAGTVSRVGFAQVEAAGLDLGGWVPTLLRVGGGWASILLWMLILQFLGKQPLARPTELLQDKRVKGHPLGWLMLSASLGPVVGIYFLMLAFAGSPAGLVQAVLASLPVLMMPVAWMFDGTVPSRRSSLAGLVAVGLTMLLVSLS